VDYLDFLGALATSLAPRSYFEIGTETGPSLARFTCDALCVDPAFRLAGNVTGQRKRSLFFQMTADQFFAEYDLRLFYPRGVDIAFLDGMHRFEYLLRDFMNTERCCHDGSLILIHDCLPVNLRMADRRRLTDDTEDESTRFWWAGDVWRLVPILKKYRPDLRVLFLDCPPTGLVAVTDLNPRSEVLRHAYYAILDEFSRLELSSYGLDQLWSLFPTLNSREVMAEDVMTSVFSLF
jgi:hypothetical protein